MKKLILFSFLLIAFYGCGESSKSKSGIPENVIESADQYVISKTGEEFFNNYIKFDSENSKNDSPYYLVKYKFQIPEKDFVDEEIYFSLDEEGKILTHRKVYGIPDCAQNPQNCEFKITEDDAVKVASEVGVNEAEGNFKSDFTWSEILEKYVWKIQLLDYEYENRGQEVLIDANNGIVLGKRIGNLD